MSKIICEVCGTAYPEASTQCPICGSVRVANAQSVPNDPTAAPQGRDYQHVKGGRFSKSNVRKRTSGNQSAPRVKPAKPAKTEHPSAEKQPARKRKKNNGNMGLVFTIFALLLAIIAVFIYVLVKFFIPAPSEPEVNTEPSEEIEFVAPTEPDQEQEQGPEGDIYCENIAFEQDVIYIENSGEHAKVTVILTPEGTTEEVLFDSEDQSVAMVESDGRVVAVRKGETIITASCGGFSAECKVIVGVPEVVFELDSTEFTLYAPRESVIIYTGEISVDEITWSSSDTSIATVSDGVVTAVSSGSTTVYAEYDGETKSCEIICDFPEETEPAPTESEQSEDSTEVTDTVETEPTDPPATEAPSSEYVAPFRMDNQSGPNDSEASLYIGNSFNLALVDSNNTSVKGVIWSVDGSSCTVSDGVVKAVRSGNCTIIATYGGQTYKFKVIVW